VSFIRLDALELALRLAKIGAKEEGGNNNGRWIRIFAQATDVGLKEGFPWCAAFVMYCLSQAGFDVKRIKNRASVGFIEQWASAHNLIVERPLRGDLVTFRFDGDDWPDHIGFVRRVLGLGPILTLSTVEGNTSSGDQGSQDDGGGVYIRRRVVRRSKVRFIRIPD